MWRRILGAKIVNRWTIFFYFRKSTHRRQKPIIRTIVVDLGDLTGNHRGPTLLGPELMIQIRRNRYRFARQECHLCAGGKRLFHTVQRNRNVGIGKPLIRCGVIYFKNEISAAPIDEILRFQPMKMHRAILARLYDQYFFAIGFGAISLQGGMAIPEREDYQPRLVESTGSKIGNVPAKHAVSDLVALAALAFPVLGRPISKWRQTKIALMQERFGVFKQPVDF